jgi:hypothetical protein
MGCCDGVATHPSFCKGEPFNMKNTFLRAALLTTLATMSMGTFGCGADADTSNAQNSDVTEGVAPVTTLLSNFQAEDSTGGIVSWDLTITHARLKTYTSLVGLGTDGVGKVQLLMFHDTADEASDQIKDQVILIGAKQDDAPYYDTLVRSESARISRHLSTLVGSAGGPNRPQVSTMTNSKTAPCPTLMEMMISIGGLATIGAAASSGLLAGLVVDVAAAGLVVAGPAVLVGAVVVGMVVLPWVLVGYHATHPGTVCLR